MIDALLAGKLYGQPTLRVGKGGNNFVTFKVRATTDAGDSILVSAIAFEADAVVALGKLNAGDSVSCSGSVIPKTWTDKEGVIRPSLDMTCHAVLTAVNNIRRKV
jgi:hypothetical protein